jgi:hypothetical protein
MNRSLKPLKHIPLRDWPAGDRSLFERAFRSATDPFDDDAGPGGHLGFRTQGAIVFAYRRWLGWLTVDEPMALTLDPTEAMVAEKSKKEMAFATPPGGGMGGMGGMD